MNSKGRVDLARYRTDHPIVVGVAGGTGSGKTTVVNEILKGLDNNRVLLLQHDFYYKDRSHLPFEERENINYDHPDALETSLLIEHLKKLKAGFSVELPIYDFATHTRNSKTWLAEPSKVIIVEGILIFSQPELRKLLDIKIFVDTDADIRFIRRMERDIAERSRTRVSVIRQYLDTVQPMHLKFVEPTKRYADVIVPEGGFNKVAIDVLITKIKSVIDKNEEMNYESLEI
jgi:uridine kinase